MNSVLEELFYGGIDPSMLFTHSAEYQKLNSEFAGICNRFQSALQSELHDEFEYVMGKSAELSCCGEKALFTMGFVLGARMMLEILQYEE